MIIPSNKIRLDGNTLTFPPYILGPIFMGHQSRFYTSIESQASGFVEVISTTIPPRYWADLWRIEIEMYDRPGNTARVLTFLAAKNIIVVLSEATIHSSSRRNKHVMSIVANCGSYRSPADGDTSGRYQDRSARLTDLENSLILHFIEHICLNELGFPKVKIRRMSQHFWLHGEHATNSRRELISHDGETYKFRYITLPANYINRLKKTLGDPLFYSAAVDTKNRVIRTLIFGGDAHGAGVRHIQLEIDPCTPHLVTRVFEILFASQANILRHHLVGMRPADSHGTEFLELSAKLDVVFEWVKAADKTLNGRFEHLIESLRSDAKLQSSVVSLTKVDGEDVAKPKVE